MSSPNASAPVPGFPVAELAIDGLAICCFNRVGEGKFWEVAYLRHPKHELAIGVQPLDALGEPVGDLEPHPVGENLLSFDISLTSGSEAHYSEFPRGGPANPAFDRAKPKDNDPHDLGWMINVTGPEPRHGKFVDLLRRGEAATKVTLARIHHSLLLTRKPVDHPVRFSSRRNNDPDGPGNFDLGRTNDEIAGLLLATAPGEIRFTSDPVGSLNITPLKYDATHRYRIELINMDVQSGVRINKHIKGDFHYFYDVIQVDGDQKELWAIPRDKGRFAPDGDCNPGTTDLATLEPLIRPRPGVRGRR